MSEAKLPSEVEQVINMLEFIRLSCERSGSPTYTITVYAIEHMIEKLTMGNKEKGPVARASHPSNGKP